MTDTMTRAELEADTKKNTEMYQWWKKFGDIEAEIERIAFKHGMEKKESKELAEQGNAARENLALLVYGALSALTPKVAAAKDETMIEMAHLIGWEMGRAGEIIQGDSREFYEFILQKSAAFEADLKPYENYMVEIELAAEQAVAEMRETRMTLPYAAPVSNAEPDAWMNVYEFNKVPFHSEAKAKSRAESHTLETAVPLYRHPAPTRPAQPVSVASQSVVEEMEAAIKLLTERVMFYDYNSGLLHLKHYNTIIAHLDAALAKITPLPEPDKFWLSRMGRHKDAPCILISTAVRETIGVGLSDIPGFCAALIAKSKEAEAADHG